VTTKSSSNGSQTKISTFVLAAVYLVFILAIAAIVGGLYVYYQGPSAQASLESAAVLMAIGFLAMALAGYILFQSRKRVAKLKIEAPPILTQIECRSCNEKLTREFKRGDFVFKDGEKCPKCTSLGMITAIYREVKEKEKPVNV
jgi:hypothetical protein